MREELWNRFKNASTVINKKHQEFFAALKAQEEVNLGAKTTLCEQVEAIDLTTLKTYKEWEAKTTEIIGLQQQWKTIGFAPRKENIKIYERFRTACDQFFRKKSEFMKATKAELDVNCEKKKALCEKAESLKDSTDWKTTTQIMEGDTTNYYIYRKLSQSDVVISTIARGVSIGNELEYADEITLGRSILNRTLFTQ